MDLNVPKDRVIDYLTPGTVIWRQCHVYTHGVTMQDYWFEPSDEGSGFPGYVCRTILAGGGKYFFEPVIADINSPGIITFIDRLPPRDWTHLVVKSTSYRRTTLFVEFNGALPVSEYLRFRQGYLSAVTDAERDRSDYFGAEFRLDIARRQHVALPEFLHRAFFSRDADRPTWSVESPLQAQAHEPVTRASRILI